MFFVNNVKYKNPYKIVFLCGSFYQENKSDKRLILKNRDGIIIGIGMMDIKMFVD